MIRTCLRAVTLALLAAMLAAAQERAVYTVSGIVVREGTNEPLNHVRVSIAPNEQPAKQLAVQTAADGKFTFTNIARGKYLLLAQSRGVTESFEQDGFFSTGIATGPNDDSTHIVFPLRGLTSLLVKVSDEEHEAVNGAQVLLFRRRVQSGWPMIGLDRQAATDSEGEAQVENLEPGIYYVAVSGRPWFAQGSTVAPGVALRGSAAKELDVAYPITYYASTENPGEATPLQLQAGNAAEVQIALRAIPAVSIKVNGMSGESDPARGGQFATALEAIGPGGVPISIYATESSQDNNQRVLQGVAPGSYRLTVSKFGESGPRPLGAMRVEARGDTEVSVSNFVRTGVTGRVSGAKGGGELQAAWLGDPMTGQNAYCPVHPDGSFECTMAGSASGSIVPGYYEVRLLGGNLYVKSLAATGARYAGGLLRVTSNSSAALSIVAAKGLTDVEGVALRDGKPVSAAMILLLPQGPESNGVLPRDQSDSDGTFKLHDVPPGRYLLVAIDHGRDLEYHDPKMIAPYLAHGRAIEVPVAASEPVKADVQTRQ